MADAVVDKSQSDGIAVVNISGSVDHTNAEAFRDDLSGLLDGAFGDAQPVVLELSGLDYISSAGLRVFMIASRTAKEKDARIVVAGWSDTIREIFTISRFNLVFDCFDTFDEARANLAGA